MKKTFVTIFFLVLFMASSSKEVLAVKKDLSLRGDPSFSSSNLSTEMQLWYSRLWGSLNRGTGMYPNVVDASKKGELYSFARTVGAHMEALLAAFRATGDLKILDHIDSLMQNERAMLRDVWSPECTQYPLSGKPADYKCTYQKDGYLNMYYWASVHTEANRPADSGIRELYFGWDTHDMEEQLAATFIAAYVDAIRINQDLRPAYKEHADFWQNYLTNHWEKKWKARKGALPNKLLTHAYLQETRYYYYMGKLTNNSSYISNATSRLNNFKTILKQVSTSKGTAYTWDHMLPQNSSYPYGCQPTGYGASSLAALTDLALEGFGPFASSSEMAKFANTEYGLIMKNAPSGDLTGNVCGGGSAESLNQVTVSTHAAPTAFETTGGMISLVKSIYDKTESSYLSAPRSPKIPAYMLLALAKKGGSTISPSPTTAPTIAPTTAPSPTPLSVKGDGNGDGKVDGMDYVIYVINSGRTNVTDGEKSGDYNLDRSVNTLDYEVWKSQFK